MKKIFVNGYGSIGNRIAKFIKDDPDIDIVGIGKHSANEKVQHVIDDGLSVYVPKDKIDNFKNYDISGSIESVIDNCDLVIDASPGVMDSLIKKIFTNQRVLRLFFRAVKQFLMIMQCLIFFLILE